MKSLTAPPKQAHSRTLAERAREVLLRHCPGSDEVTIGRFCEDIEFAAELMVSRPAEPRLKSRDARVLSKAARTTRDLASTHNLASPEELKILDRLARDAALALFSPLAPGPSGDDRRWIGPCCRNFLDAHLDYVIGGRKLYDWDGESPQLLFLVDCCRLLDPEVNATAIRRAVTDDPSVAESDEAYSAWWSEFKQFRRDRDL